MGEEMVLAGGRFERLSTKSAREVMPRSAERGFMPVFVVFGNSVVEEVEEAEGAVAFMLWVKIPRPSPAFVLRRKGLEDLDFGVGGRFLYQLLNVALVGVSVAVEVFESCPCGNKLALTGLIVCNKEELTGKGFGLSPKFLACLASATGLCFERWKPKPRIAVGGISPSAIPPRER